MSEPVQATRATSRNGEPCGYNFKEVGLTCSRRRLSQINGDGEPLEAYQLSFTLRLMALFLLAASIVTAPHRVSAAQIEAVPDREHCAIRLEGEIKAGDADRFADLLSKFAITAGEEAEGISSDRALCLDSPGGNYLEGRKIAQLVHERGITTRVEAARDCYSACALIFYGGQNPWRRERYREPLPSR